MILLDNDLNRKIYKWWHFLLKSNLPFYRVKSMLSMENTSTPLPGSRSHHHRSRDCTPTRLILSDGSSRDFVHSPPSILSDGTYNTLTPSRSPVNTRLRSDMVNGKLANSRHSPPDKNSQRRGYNWIQKEEALPRPNFEPKNLLSLFEETTPWIQGCQLPLSQFVWGPNI